MSVLKKNNIENLKFVPHEVAQCIEGFEKLDLNLSTSNIDVTEFKRKQNYSIVETCINITIEDEESVDNKSIQISYIKSIDYEGFFEDCILIMEDFIRTIEYSRNEYNYSKNFDMIISEYIKKNNCENSSENTLKALREIALKLYYEDRNKEEIRGFYSEEFEEFENINEQYNNISLRKDTSIVEVDLHTSNIDIIYLNNLIKGGIFKEDGGMIFFEANIDENKTINTIKLYTYASVSDIAYAFDNRIDYSKNFVEWNGYSHVKPTQVEEFDFNELLKEYNMSELSENPIIAIYKLKDILISKSFEKRY